MSSLIVKVRRVSLVCHHPHADHLDIATVEGWEVIVGRDTLKVGDLVTFVPPDAVIPTELADKMGFRQYLRGTNHDRVGVTKIRGVVSYGLVLPIPSGEVRYLSKGLVSSVVEGSDVAEFWGITKFEPPIHPIQGAPREKDLTFPEYLEIENIKNFKSAFQEGEEVFVTEKIDGRNSRVGIEIRADEFGMYPFLKAGSHRTNRQNLGEENWKNDCYWFPHSLKGIQDYFKESLLGHWGKTVGNGSIIYGEVFGAVQGGLKKMNYGSPNKLQFRAFAAMVNYTWMKPAEFFELCETYNIPRVPILYQGPYDKELIDGLLQFESATASLNGADQICEGVVIQSALNPLKTLKLLNPKYLIVKNKAEDKGEEFDRIDE